MQLLLAIVLLALQKCVHSFIAPSKVVHNRVGNGLQLSSDSSDANIADITAFDNELRFSGVGR
jgi:hypothetical protein